MGTSKPSPNELPKSDELLGHYKPLAIKAVLAVCAVRTQPIEPVVAPSIYAGPLPEGFHMPLEPDD